jgi:hypothetical protein
MNDIVEVSEREYAELRAAGSLKAVELSLRYNNVLPSMCPIYGDDGLASNADAIGENPHIITAAFWVEIAAVVVGVIAGEVAGTIAHEIVAPRPPPPPPPGDPGPGDPGPGDPGPDGGGPDDPFRLRRVAMPNALLELLRPGKRLPGGL